MNEQGTEKRKWRVTAPVRNKKTAVDFANITAISSGTTAKGGRGDIKIQRKLYRVPGTVKSKRPSAGGGGDI